MNLSAIKKDITDKNFAPFYFFHGKEPFFIDKAVELLQNGILAEEERDFNQTIFYGKDAEVQAISETAKRYPMMAERCAVILKEAQGLDKKKLDALEAIIANPSPSTVFVFAYKGEFDKRKKIYKLLSKAGKTFESKPLYENEIPNWIKDQIVKYGLKISTPAIQLLASHLGTDLHKLNDALSKLAVVCPKGSEVTPKEIEYNIGINREFNVFELNNAFAENDIPKIMRITQFFEVNSKDVPPLVISSTLFSFFNKVMIYHYLSDKSKGNVATALKVNPYFIGQYVSAAKTYNAMKVLKIIDILRDFDMRFKGKNVGSTPPAALLKEMSLRIISV